MTHSLPKRIKLSGVTFGDAQLNIEVLTKSGYEPFELIREPRNPYNPNAIRVEWRGCYVGYIPTEIARHLAPMIDNGKRLITCNHQLNKSPYHDTIGITVELREV